MEEIEQAKSQALATRLRLDALQKLMVIQQRVGLTFLVVASLIAPLTAVVYQPSSTNPTTTTYTMLGTVQFLLGGDYLKKSARPGTILQGMGKEQLAGSVALVLLLIAAAALFVVTLRIWKKSVRGVRPALVAVGIALTVFTGIGFFAMPYLSNFYLEFQATGWFGLPIAAGAWAVYHAWSLEQLL